MRRAALLYGMYEDIAATDFLESLFIETEKENLNYGYSDVINLSLMYAALGDNDKAISFLERFSNSRLAPHESEMIQYTLGLLDENSGSQALKLYFGIESLLTCSLGTKLN